MELAESSSSLPSFPAVPESAMTIDYDAEPSNEAIPTTIGGGGGGDEEMGDDESNLEPSSVPTEGVAEVEEAEMADDEASTWEKDAMIEEAAAGGGTESISAEVPTTTLEREEDVETLPAVSASTSLVEEPIAPIEPEVVSDLPLPTASTSLDAPSTIVETTSTTTQLEPALSTEVALSEGEQADAEQSDFPSNPLESADVLTTTSATTKEVTTTMDDGTSVPFLRPNVDKALLLGIEVPFPLDESSPSSSSQSLAPAVLFNYDNATYSLFRSHKPVPQTAHSGDDSSPTGTVEGDNEAQEEEEPQALLTEIEDQQLYFGTLEHLFSKLHDQFPELQSREDELVLDFDEIGVALTEDNVYSRQVSLHDFDRIHLGCGLPGRLHARLYAQSRFSSGFNALAQHVANTLNGNNATEEGNDSEATYEAEDGTVNGDEENEETNFGEESFVTVGEPEDHDADGPDSELPTIDQQQEEGEPGVEGEGGEEEEFDLESALAQLDGDDIAAYVEGAAEDYILSEGGERAEEVEAENKGGENEERIVGDGNEGETTVEEEQQPLVEANQGETESTEKVDESAQPPEPTEEPQIQEQTIEIVNPESDQVESTTIGEVASTNSTEQVPPENSINQEINVGDNVQAEEPSSSNLDPSTVDSTLPDEAATLESTVPEVSIDTASEPNGHDHPAEVAENGTENEISKELPAAEDTVDPNDVVIDYDEAFDGSTPAAIPPLDLPEAPENETATVPLEQSPAKEEAPVVAPHSPKRRHDSLDADEADGLAEAATDGNDAKRPRLEESNAVTSS
ncbi:uncharacterized protein JCM6883_001209 [Sporobolomyces salmoneus]|uniref:uncharacterized protein n=1 Tax=Sporobolomyces salmoneus TaxID=183962 RepID=UPI0031788750